MSVERFSPEGMFQPTPGAPVYDHVSVGTGTRHVHVAGQISRDGDGNAIAPGDLRGQVAQAVRNAHRGLAGAGATFADVVRWRFYGVGWGGDDLGTFLAGIEDVADELGIPHPYPPVSVIGVDLLFEPDVLVEVEVDAILD